MLKRVVESELDEARQYLLGNVIETYFRLGRRQREQFIRVVARKEYAKVHETELTWGDELLLKGRQEGVVQGKRETLKRLLTAKFGPLPKDTEALLDAVQSAEKLDQYLDRVLVAESLEELGLEEK
ncbi:MAG TPA: hypothetical protein VEK15_20280 [Vicinamibacteria bacterium]|nr:hypothetical protein [Vicinamibacteria bacterium]